MVSCAHVHVFTLPNVASGTPPRRPRRAFLGHLACSCVLAHRGPHNVSTRFAMPFATHAKRRPNAVLFAAPQSTSPSGIRREPDGGVLPEHVLSSILSSSEDPWTRASEATPRTTQVSSSSPMAIGGGASAPQLHVHTGLAGDGDEVTELCEGFGRTTLLGSDAEFETAYSIGDELGRGGWATVFTARRRRRGAAATLVDQGSRGSVPSPDPLLLLASATGWPPPAMASGAGGGHGRDGQGLAVKVMHNPNPSPSPSFSPNPDPCPNHA